MTQPAFISLRSNAMTASFLPRGASLVELRPHALDRNLVLGFDDPDDHHKIPIYAGAIVGPIANRVSEGKVKIAGHTHFMARNENGTTTLHSGNMGLHTQLWQLVEHTKTSVVFQHRLVDGEAGLPGNREITLCYTLEDTRLNVAISATTDRTTALNIAAHPYWNLEGTRDISGHLLTLEAEHYLPLNAKNLPSGAPAPVAGTRFDFRTPKHVPIGQGLDHNFCLARKTAKSPRRVCTLAGRCGTALTLSTTAPGLQVYDGAYLPHKPGALMDKRDLHPFGAIALEPQFWPDAPNHPAFPSILHGPDAPFRQETVFDVTLP